MDRTTAADRATRAAEAKGHALGEWVAEDERMTGISSYAQCLHCPHETWLSRDLDRGGYNYGGNALLYLCRPSGKRGTLTHTNEE